MSKLLSVLVAGLLAGGAMAQSTAPVPPTTKPSGTSATTGAGTSTSTTTGTGTSTGTGTTSGTTTGTGSTSGSTTTGSGTGSTGTGSATGALGAGSGSLACPAGLEKRDNSCLPPGQEKKPEDQRRSSQTR